MLASAVRGLIKRLPRWLWRRILTKIMAARHQASFLPLIEDNTKSKPVYQRSLHKTLVIHKELVQKPLVVAAGSIISVNI